MSPANHIPSRNLLLASLDAQQRTLLRPSLEPVDLALGTVLENPGEPITHVY